MKKIIALIIIALLITFDVLGSLSFSENELKLQEAIFDKLLVVSIGNGEQEVAYSLLIGGDENDGPASFEVDENGDIYILDTLNKKILIYENGNWYRNIDISFTNYPRDIVVAKNNLFVLDESNILYDIDKKGCINNLIALPEGLEAYKFNKMFISSNDNIIISDGNYEYEFNKQWQKQRCEVLVKYDDNGKKVSLIKNTKDFSDITFLENTGGVNVIGFDSLGNMYIEVLDFVPNSSLVLLESTIRKIDHTGKQVGIARIPLEEYSNFPLKFFDISSRGEVYIMAMKIDCIEISRISLGKSYNSKMDNLKVKAYNNERLNKNSSDLTGSVKSAPEIPTRNEVLTRAEAIVGLSWTCNSENSSNPPADVMKADYLGYATSYPESMIGIPYCWGGFDGVDTSSSTQWSNFKDAMNNDIFAGNVNTSGYYKRGTAGIDCSGFVSSAYDLDNKYGTSTFISWGTVKNNPQYMDYYVKRGHILLYRNHANSTTINSMEATKTGDDKAKYYMRTFTWLSTNGYALRSPWY